VRNCGVVTRHGSTEAFATTLHERAAALRTYIEEIAAENSGSDATVGQAFDAFYLYTQKLDEQAEKASFSDEDPIGVLGPLLAHLRKVELIADQLFSRGHVLAVPKALRLMTMNELKRLGLVNHKPVLVLGPPQNFETYIGDLREHLFDPQIFDLVELPSVSDVLAIVSLPYLEGTRALWQPVTMGHELAHLSDRETHVTDSIGANNWLSRIQIESLNDQELPIWFDQPLDPLQEAQTVLTNWIREILCDLHTIRRFGPAGFAAISEFLLSIGALEKESFSHPPGSLRIHCMSEVLGNGLGVFEDLVKNWREFGAPSPHQLRSNLAVLLADLIVGHLDEIAAAAKTIVAESYPWFDRQSVIDSLRANFVQYVPAIEVYPSGQDVVLAEDVLNAGWLARTEHETTISRMHRSAALVMLDRIVNKALGDLDLVSMWTDLTRESGRDLASTPHIWKGRKVSTAESPSDKVANASVLSADAIQARLQSCAPAVAGSAQPLIVTPLISPAIQGAALDVRLSTKFIAFRRSGTPVFDWLDSRQDPREVQERVEKDWAGRFILHPLEMVLASTLEYIVMPADLTAQVITRSSHGRLGLLSATAVLIHPHFKGCLTLELINLGQVPIALTPGERIAQLTFFPVSPPAAVPVQKYEYPTGPQFSRVRYDQDLQILMRMRERRAGPTETLP
jgi:deoxycytidine triphosphate deaminase